MRLAVFTVCPNHRVPHARALLETVARFLPQATRFLVLADQPHPGVPYPSNCQLVPARALGVPDFPQFAFRYDPAEFAAALKPFAFRFLHDTGNFTHCLYFDPGIELFSALPTVTEALAADAPFVLTPHILAPPEGEDDLEFLRKGAFDLAFLGVAFTPQAQDLLGWWARWLRRDCIDDPALGFHVDGRFMDLVPSFASGVRILYDPGLNVSPDNLVQRRFAPGAPGGPQAGGSPLGFFHYRDLAPGQLEAIPPACRAFLASYAARLEGHGKVPPETYAFARFASGTPIPHLARRMFRDDHEAWAGDPFETYEPWCHLPARDAVPGLGTAIPSLALQWLQARRPALAAMNVREEAGAAALARWWLEHGPAEGIDPRFLHPIAQAAGRRPLKPGAIRPSPSPDRADVTVVAPFSSQDPASQVARSLAEALSQSAHVERLDVLAATTHAATGRVLVLCMPPRHLRPFLHVLGTRLPARAYRIFVPADETAELSPAFLEALAGFDEVWAPTSFLQSRLVLATGLPTLHMPLLHIPPARRTPTPGRPPGRPYVLAMADAFPGCAELHAAVRAYQAAFHDTPEPLRPRLILSGKAHEWDESLRNAAGAAPTPDPANLLAGASCLLALHRGEALGMSVLHAMAGGIPVVATDDGGCTDLLTPRTGFPIGTNPHHAAWSLREAFDRPDEARRRAAQARQALAASPDLTRPAARLAAIGLLPARHMLDAAA